MDYALVFKWNKAVPGREAMGLQVLGDIHMFFGKLFADGKIAEPINLNTVGESMMIIRGEMSFMFELMRDEEYLLLITKAIYCADTFEVQPFFADELYQRTTGIYAEAGRELAYL